MSITIEKKRDGKVIAEFPVKNWPHGSTTAEFVTSAIKMWGTVACARFINGAAKIEARAAAVAMLNGTKQEAPVTVEAMQKKMAGFAPNTRENDRALTPIERTIKGLKKDGYTEKQIAAMLKAGEEA